MDRHLVRVRPSRVRSGRAGRRGVLSVRLSVLEIVGHMTSADGSPTPGPSVGASGAVAPSNFLFFPSVSLLEMSLAVEFHVPDSMNGWMHGRTDGWGVVG